MKPVELAKHTIETYIKTGEIVVPPTQIIGIDVEQAGTFVSIKTELNELRGCIGTISPVYKTIQEEIIKNAIAAATQDPRFNPIEAGELNGLKISVDVLHKPEPITAIDQLDPIEYGIIVFSKSGKRALLLPNLEGVDTVEKQLSICKNKAGIAQNEPVAVQRFKVDRYYE